MRKWLDSDRILEELPEEDYRCDIGVVRVVPSFIVGLSRPYEEIIDDDSIKTLRENVAREGWKDPHPRGLSLYLLPNDTLIVVHGGNHRAVLSNELGLDEIKANVTVVVPHSDIPFEILTEHCRLKKKLVHTRQRLKFVNDDEERWAIYEACDDVEGEIYELLKAFGMARVVGSNAVKL